MLTQLLTPFVKLQLHSNRMSPSAVVDKALEANKDKRTSIDLVQKYAYLFEGVENDFERTGFVQVRLIGPKEKKVVFAKKPRAKDGA